MRIGILADIHADIENLSKAIDRLRREEVDSFVVLGDVIFDRRNASETVALLTQCSAIGVWGNHELGLCVDPEDDVCALYTAEVMQFFGTLNAHLELGDVLFSHTFPDQNARDPVAFYLGGEPHQQGALENCFAQFPHRVIMAGHFHRWFAATPSGQLAWQGEQPIKLESDKRYFFIIDAVMNGWAAVFDEEQNVLIPIQV